MKIKDGFMLREIAGSWVVVPIGQRVVEFNGLMTLSESGAMLWQKLEEGAEEKALTELILKEYNVDETLATKDVQEFLSILKERELLV